MNLLDEDVVEAFVEQLSPDVLSRVRTDLLDDPRCGPPLKNYLAFDSGVAAVGLSREDRFYNKYFWFKRFAHEYQVVYGQDAGIDQQAHKLLEFPDCDPDWEVIPRIEKLAEGLQTNDQSDPEWPSG
jgi:hypothetical protein